MYLTRMDIAGHHRSAMKLLTNRHAMHAAIRSTVGDEAVHPRWRLDGFILYLVTDDAPSLASLRQQLGSTSVATRDYASVLGAVRPGLPVAFRLDAVTVARSKSGQRALNTDQQREWIMHRQEQIGMSIDDVTLAGDTWKIPRNGDIVVLPVARFAGAATITDPVAAVAALCQGVGRGRGYGAGLMTISARAVLK